MDIRRLCLDTGAHRAEIIPVERLTLTPELRALCERNACGRFGRNHTCPPLVGDVEALIARLRSFQTAVVFQNIYPLEDSFDIEGMTAAQVNHNAMTLQIAQTVYGALGRANALVLAAGGCTQCETCAAADGEPCRGQDGALASLEAYGVHVSKIEEVSGMRYINGVNTVTYFSGVFYDQTRRTV